MMFYAAEWMTGGRQGPGVVVFSYLAAAGHWLDAASPQS